MKHVFVVAALSAAIVSPAAAQDAHAGHGDHAAAAHAAVALFSLDTPIEQIVADARGKAVLDAQLPGLTTHEHYEMFKGMTLNQLAAMAPDKVSPELVAKVSAGLAAIK